MAEIEGIFTRLIDGLKAKYPALDDGLLKGRLADELGQVRRLMDGILLLGQCPDNISYNFV